MPPAAPTMTSGVPLWRDQAASTAFARTLSQASITACAGRGSSVGPVARVDELLDRRDRAARVDVGDACAQRLDLGHAERGAERLHLAVDVRLGDLVEVDQRQRGDAAARQRLGGPRADAADADDGDVRRADPRIGGVAVEPAQAAEAAFEVGVVAARPAARAAPAAGGVT